MICNKCRASRQKAYRDALPPERRQRDRLYMRGWRFGIKTEAVAAMLAQQNGRCAVCLGEMTMGRGAESAHLDHDKQTGKIRGFLCGACNWNVGFYETVQSFSSRYRLAIEAYLRRYR
jgi:hypothetical protein